MTSSEITNKKSGSGMSRQRNSSFVATKDSILLQAAKLQIKNQVLVCRDKEVLCHDKRQSSAFYPILSPKKPL